MKNPTVQQIITWTETVPGVFLVELIRQGWDKPMVEVMDQYQWELAKDEELHYQIENA